MSTISLSKKPVLPTQKQVSWRMDAPRNQVSQKTDASKNVPPHPETGSPEKRTLLSALWGSWSRVCLVCFLQTCTCVKSNFLLSEKGLSEWIGCNNIEVTCCNHCNQSFPVEVVHFQMQALPGMYPTWSLAQVHGGVIWCSYIFYKYCSSTSMSSLSSCYYPTGQQVLTK